MKAFIDELIREAYYSLQELRKDKMTLTDRVKLEKSLLKLEIARRIISKFTIQ